jgi:hypothetical protein
VKEPGPPPKTATELLRACPTKKSSGLSFTRLEYGPNPQRGTASPPNRGRRRALVAGALALIAAAACICALAGARHSDLTTDQAGALPPQAAFGPFPPCTEAERALEKLLQGRDERIDLALANWLIVADIPQFADLTREAYFARLDAMTEQVLQEMARVRKIALSRGKKLDDPDTRCGIFCNAVIKLGLAYAEEYRQHDLSRHQEQALHGDANKTFLAGLLRTRSGSCVSMPLIYLVIGQRLGFPVHLVAIGRHYFIRWEEPGYRMNIETTAVDKVWVTDDDSAYLQEEGLTREQLKGSDLRNLTNREVVGQLFFTRSAYWVMSAARSKSRSRADLARAFYLCPEDPAIQRTHQAVFNQYHTTAEDTRLVAVPVAPAGSSRVNH